MFSYRLVNNWLTVKSDEFFAEGQIKVKALTEEELKEFQNISDYSKLRDFALQLVEPARKFMGLVNQYPNHLTLTESGVCVKGLHLPMPEVLLEKLDKSNIESLCNFWRLCALNPNKEAREKLMEYVDKNGYYITTNGMLVTFRRADKKGTFKASVKNFSDEFIGFIVKQYQKIKSWKKSPSKYFVYFDEIDSEWKISPDSTKAESDKNTLQNFYDEIITKEEEEKVEEKEEFLYYASNPGDRSFYFDGVKVEPPTYYALNHETRLSREDCDEDSEVSCSSGLHTGTPDFVKTGGIFGNTIIVCLVNPADVCAIPYSDMHKMRSAALYPIAEISIEELDSFDYGFAEMKDHEYAPISYDILQDMIEEGVFIVSNDLKEESVSDLLEKIKADYKDKLVVEE